MEIDSAYRDATVRRWRELTRQRALLDREDRVLDDIANARGWLAAA
jgi:hypothetical protein